MDIGRQRIYDFMVSQNPDFLKEKPEDVVDFALSQNPDLLAEARRDIHVIESPINTGGLTLPKPGPSDTIRGLTGVEKIKQEYGDIISGGLGVAGAFGGAKLGGALLGSKMGTVVGGALGAGLGAGLGSDVSGQPVSESIKTGMEAAALSEVAPVALKGIGELYSAIRLPITRTILSANSALRGSRESRSALARYITSPTIGSTKRGVKRTLGEIRKGDELADITMSAEKQGVASLKRVQQSVERERARAGKLIGTLKNKVADATKGKTYDISSDIAPLKAEFNALRASRGAEALPAEEINKLGNILDNISNNPNLTFRQMDELNTNLKNLVDYNRSAVGEKVFAPAENIIKGIRSNVGNRMKKIASDNGVKTYSEAHDNFATLADGWDEVFRGSLGTRTQGALDMSSRFKGLSNMFDEGGYRMSEIEKTMKLLPPGGQKMGQKLLDTAALYNLYRPFGGPSSLVAGIARSLITKFGPNALRNAKQIDNALKSELMEQAVRGSIPLGEATTEKVME